MSLVRKWMPSPCYSSRGGTKVRLIVLHTAEGANTIESLGNFFANPATQASSHAGADDKVNTVGIYVDRPNKAWTQANANPYCVSIEMCAFAKWTLDQWNQHPNMLANTAAWIAEEAAAFGIPIRRLSAVEAQSGQAGVCQHVDLGPAGGGHWDCGSGFPMDRVIQMAAGGAPAPGPTPPPQEVDDLPLHIVIADPNTDGGKWYLTDWVHKWWLPSADVAAQIIVSTVATGGKIEQNGQNGPVKYAKATVDAVPDA